MLLSHWSIAPFCVDEAFSTLLGRGRPYCYPPSEATEVFRAAIDMAAAPQRGANPSFATGELGEVVCPNSCERPVLFCLTTSRMPRFVFRADTGVCPYGWTHPYHPCPYGWMKKTPFCAPKLHFRCISNTLQRYEKFLKLTNCKHKIFKNFSSARLYYCVSDGYN